MNYHDFKSKITAGQIAPIYLFHGEEEHSKEEAVNFFKKAVLGDLQDNMALEILGEDNSLESILEAANTFPLFTHKKLVLVQNSTLFLTKKGQNKAEETGKEKELLTGYLANPSPLSKIAFVIKGKADSRKKLFQVLAKQDLTIEFKQLRGQELLNWTKGKFLERKKKINYAVLDYLLACQGNNLAVLQQEIDKICLYLGDETEEVPLEVVQNLVSKTSQTTIFNLVDAFVEQKGAKAIQYCRDLVKMGEPEILIVYMLARQFRLILEAKLLLAKGYHQSQLPQMLQTQSFTISKVVKQGQRYHVPELISNLEKLLELDIALKTGQGNRSMLLELTVAELCKGT
ncbi:DNA polymerase III subunit delta [Bacillota bacterium LX-D]|nr:DNA polymerase III subunit delta [Bacillota bacterium LX-D]